MTTHMINGDRLIIILTTHIKIWYQSKKT